MRSIPPRLRESLARDPFMKRCIVPGCGGQPIEWNHAIIYCGRQVNTWYAIVPLCTAHHRGNSGTIYAWVKWLCIKTAIERSRGQIHQDCPKQNWYAVLEDVEYKLNQRNQKKNL